MAKSYCATGALAKAQLLIAGAAAIPVAAGSAAAVGYIGYRLVDGKLVPVVTGN